MSLPGVPSLLEEICHGRLPWELVHPFPVQSPADELDGDLAVAQIREVLREHLDPAAVESDNRLPDWLVPALRDGGLLNLLAGDEVGGRGLSPYNAFRVIAAAADASVGTSMMLAIHNGIGAAGYLPVLPDGPLRDFVRDRVRDGTITGMADTEPTGAANGTRDTTARLLPDGSGYVLDGEKLYIGNGTLAGLLAVTATTVVESGREQVRVFFVDTGSPGFSVRAPLEFMGLRGFPNAALSLRGVHVPAERLLEERGGQWLTTERAVVLSRGRVYIVGAPSLAIARQCLDHARSYVSRRRVDGRPLTGYDEIRRMIAASLADLHALDTTTRWVMLADQDGRQVNPMLEQVAAKDITSLLCWRIAERTMTLLAGEGYETVAGKAGRGGPTEPMERLYRDARGLRVAGGTEVLLQTRLARNIVFSYFYPEPDDAAQIEADGTGTFDVPELSARNQGHLSGTATEVRRFARTCLLLARRYPDPAVLFARGPQMRLVGQIAEELVTMVLTLGRAAGAPADDNVQDLTDIYCGQARQRLASWWRELEDAAGDDPVPAATVARWLPDAASTGVPEPVSDRAGAAR